MRLLSGTFSFLDRPWGKLAYRTSGTGRPLLLLHSLALSSGMWEPVLSEFAAGRRIVTVDLRGHGRSAWDWQAFSVEDMADDICCLIDALGVPGSEPAPVDVIGMSMGGTVAVALAAMHPELVGRLVACDTTAWYGPNAPEAWEQRARAAETTTREMQVPFQTDRWFGESFRRHHPETVSTVVGIFLSTSPEAHAAACRALGAYDGRSTLEAITATTLVATGEEDFATPPSMGVDLAAGISGATLQVWPGLRHFALIESSALRSAIRAFLSGDTVPPPTPQSGCCQAVPADTRSEL